MSGVPCAKWYGISVSTVAVLMNILDLHISEGEDATKDLQHQGHQWLPFADNPYDPAQRHHGMLSSHGTFSDVLVIS